MEAATIIVSSPGVELNPNLVASPVKASGEADNVDDLAAAPVPRADMMRPVTILPSAGVEVAKGARPTQT